MKNLSEFYLSELSAEESNVISGGDKFMSDLGYAVGYLWGLYKDAAHYLSSQSF